jgi:hypothetical protein
MSVLIAGTSGLVQIGPTNHLTTVGLVTEFSVECATEITAKGPYIGDATIRKVRGAKTSSGSLSADIPDGRNTGQTGLLSVHESGTNVRLYLQGGDGTDGYEYVAANCAISGVTFTGNAEDGYSFEFTFEDMDGYTLEASS